jgi:hypothetical protein
MKTMIDKLKNIKIPRRVAILHLACWGGLLLFLMAVVLPLYGSMTGLDRQMRDLRSQVDEQKNLHPLYQTLQAKGRNVAPSVLPTPDRGKLSRDLIATVPAAFRRIGQNAGMESFSVSPDASSLAGNSPFLLVRVTAQGDFLNFRRYLIGLGELPYLDRVEEIEIRQNPDIMEFRVTVRLALG